MGEPELQEHKDNISLDLFCIWRGYNLKSLGGGNLCPECGRPVER